MSATYTLPDGSKLEMWSDPIEVTSNGPRPDPSWLHTDANGHEHRWVDGELPSLRWVVDEEDYVVVEDGYPEEYPGSGHYECTQCFERVEPGMRGPSGFREFIPGPVHCTLDGQPISREDAQALIEEARAIVRRSTDISGLVPPGTDLSGWIGGPDSR